jgi:histidine phosphotransferase ChpT
MTEDLRITQLLCSRLCHDLVGPIGAINNGVELIGEAPDMLEDSLSLLSNSASQASRRIAFYRAAFGFGGGDGPGALKEVREISHDFVAGSPVTLNWPDDSVMIILPKNAVKLLMILIFLGVGTLIRGGTLDVQIAEQGGTANIIIKATGKGAMLKEDLGAALSPAFSVDDLTAHTVHAHFATMLAGSVGAEVSVQVADSDEITFAATVSI